MLTLIKDTRILIAMPNVRFRLHKTHQWRSNRNSLNTKPLSKLEITINQNLGKVILPGGRKYSMFINSFFTFCNSKPTMTVSMIFHASTG